MVFQVESTDLFDDWLRTLRDRKGRARILARIDSAALGNLGDVKSVGAGVPEMRVHFGPGYRIYFAQRGAILLLLLCGGDKSTQGKDIARAQRMLKSLVEVSLMAKVKRFDPSEFLDDDEVVAEYLSATLQDPNPDVFLTAIGNVAKARGIGSIAQSTGLGRESLYKALTPGAKPRYDTVLKVLHGLGVKLSITAA